MFSDGSSVTIRELIDVRRASFTPSERKLARALLASYPTAGLEPLSKLATRAGVSPPTALRLVAKLGFDGYPAFQQQLREEVQLRIDSPVRRYGPTGREAPEPASPLAEFESLAGNLKATAEALDGHEFNTVVELLADSRRRITVVGGVVSRVLATHLVHRLTQLRPGVRLSPETSPGMLNQAVDLQRRDIVVAFDYKRYQRDTNAFLRRAARQKSTIVLCTDSFHQCPALDVASHVLTFSVDGPPPFDSPIGGFALVETLGSCLAARLGEAGRARIARLEDEDSEWMWDSTLLQEAAADSPASAPSAAQPRRTLPGPLTQP
jgi:DNA-binding MurR/RpiR family transcriptional regulator